MNYLPLIVLALAFVVLLLWTSRARRRQAESAAAVAERIAVGTDVMTTSGLHGTVTAKHDDGTVLLAIAPGVEVRWELAALRDTAALPAPYRRAAADAEPDAD